MHLPGAAQPPLAPATARVLDPDGRSAGHVLCAGPVPWVEDGGAWVLTLGLADRARGRGLGRGAARCTPCTAPARRGCPRSGLSVTEGNPAQRAVRRPRVRAGRARALSVRLPRAQHDGPAPEGDRPVRVAQD